MNDMVVAGRKNRTPGFLPPRRLLSDFIFCSRLYASTLKSRTPKKPLPPPADMLPGRSLRADALFQGHFEFAGHELVSTNQEPWFAPDMPVYWHQELHSFGWLRDFSANGSDAAKRHSRALVRSWLQHFSEYSPYIWDAETLARRLINWTCHTTFLMDNGGSDFNYLFLKSIRRQYKHLMRVRRLPGARQSLFTLHMALFQVAISFPDSLSQGKRHLARMMTLVNSDILPDGCHISRNPGKQITMLADLVSLRQTLLERDMSIPVALNNAIDRSAPVVRFFQHGDGASALFNGSVVGDPGMADQLLAVSNAPGRPPHHLPYGGFERLKAGRALLLLETGKGGRPANRAFHAGIGGFEFSVGRERLVVNCGSHPVRTSAWGKALAATAAHSTLSIGEINAAFPAPTQSREDDPTQVTVIEEGGSLWLDFENTGYESRLGVTHQRRLYLDASGQNLRGEDTVRRPESGDETTDFCLRFHLHPDLSLSRNHGGNSLLIRTPSGAGWRFVSSLSELSLEESVYCEQPGRPRKNYQIVLKGRLNGTEPLSLKWAFSQLGDEQE
ncbi:heparinase II/III family protein [Sneathiella chinensis]|uniref:Heparinase n=1 Tax=Sneathiella chinensis TaxID=349750 RepID=A0ABQ5TYV7_9PROT|nr:heparinase II/III family protein [Sneathiella chinensis]GLQ05032.1 heparinase [Sneathiella chinensis]